MNENNATVMYEKRFFKTIGKIVKKKVELVGNFVSVLQAVKCQIPLVVMMGSKDEAFDIERSLNAMLGAHQNFKSMPEIKLLKSYSKSPNISAGDCVTTSFIHFTNEESEFFNFVVELLNMPLFLENYRQYCSQNQKEARKLLFDVYSEIGQFYKEFEEYAESLEEGIRLPGVGFEIDRHLYANSKRIIDACKASDEVDVIRRANGEIGPDCAYVVRVRNGASQAIEIDEALADDLFAADENLDADDPRFEGDGEEIEDEDEDEDCEDGGEEDDDDDAGGNSGGGPGNSSSGGNNAGGNNAGGPGGPGGSGGNNTGGPGGPGRNNGKSGK
jgi:hypothetical protein